MNRGQIKPCPESPERAQILLDAAADAGSEFVPVEEFDASARRAVHDPGYLQFLENAWGMWSRLADYSDEVIPNVHPGRHMGGRPKSIVGLAGHYQADCACPIGVGTWRGVVAAVETALTTAKLVMSEGDGAFAYALCRPPGHHAFADMAGGFCYLNNTAIAAQYCLSRGANRVAIVDVDAHHGNGTQSIFYQRSDVFTISLHGDPADYYPFFSGYAEEHGAGAGFEFNLNVPLPRDTADDAYLENLQSMLGLVSSFRAEVLLVALGLDASHDDPLQFLRISTDGFRRIGTALGALGLPTVLVQEGGYVSESLGANLVAALEGFERAR